MDIQVDYARLADFMRRMIEATMEGPPKNVAVGMSQDSITGIKAGTCSVAHALAALIADMNHVSRGEIVADFGLTAQAVMMPAHTEKQLDDIIRKPPT